MHPPHPLVDRLRRLNRIRTDPGAIISPCRRVEKAAGHPFPVGDARSVLIGDSALEGRLPRRKRGTCRQETCSFRAQLLAVCVRRRSTANWLHRRWIQSKRANVVERRRPPGRAFILSRTAGTHDSARRKQWEAHGSMDMDATKMKHDHTTSHEIRGIIHYVKK